MKFIAHGGYCAKYPENTLISFQKASKYSPYAIELDVVLHPDVDELICFHPQGLSSNSGVYSKENVRQQISSGSEYPKLSDVLDKVECELFLIDFKQPSRKSFEVMLGSELDLEKVIVGIRNVDHFDLLKNLNSEISTLALFSDPDNFQKYIDSGGRRFRLWEKDASRDRIETLHNAGLEVWITPGNKATSKTPRTSGEIDAERLNMLIDLGVDAIFVNDIAAAVDWQNQRKN